LLAFLVGEGFVNYWNTSDLKAKAYKLISNNLLPQLLDYLSSPLATNTYLLLYSQYQKATFVKNLHQLYKVEVEDALSRLRYFAVYLILELIDRDTYMKLTDFAAFNRCMENTN
jgi:hypothetical protein